MFGLRITFVTHRSGNRLSVPVNNQHWLTKTGQRVCDRGKLLHVCCCFRLIVHKMLRNIYEIQTTLSNCKCSFESVWSVILRWFSSSFETASTAAAATYLMRIRMNCYMFHDCSCCNRIFFHSFSLRSLFALNRWCVFIFNFTLF